MVQLSEKILNEVNSKIKIIIGLTGPIFSGCTTTAKYLEKIENFGRISISEEFIDQPLLQQDRKEPEREQKQNFGDEQRQTEPAYFVHRSIERIHDIIYVEKKDRDYFVVECLRNHAEVLEFRKLFQDKFFLIAIHASRDLRSERANIDSKKFKNVDDRDSEDIHLNGQQVKRCMELADAFLSNNHNIVDLDVKDEHFASRFKIDFDNFLDDRVARFRFMKNPTWSIFMGFLGKLNRIIDVIRSEKLFNPTTLLIDTKDHLHGEHVLTEVEVFMSIAYHLSLFSNCRKRKVGAIITKTPLDIECIDPSKEKEEKDKKRNNDKDDEEKDGTKQEEKKIVEFNEYIISSGWNQVILKDDFCRRNEFCFRDYNKLKYLINNIKKCPNCGSTLQLIKKTRIGTNPYEGEALTRIEFKEEGKDRKEGEIIKDIRKQLIDEEDHPDYYRDEDKEVIVRCSGEREIPCDFNHDHVPGKNIKKLFPTKDLYDCQAVHADENAILNSSRFGGTPLQCGTIYSTTFPCFLCTKKIIAAKLKRVVYMEPYPDERALWEFKKVDIKTEQFVGFTPYRFCRLFKTYFL